MRLVVRFLFAVSLLAMMISTVHAQPPTLLWSDPVDTYAIALSEDGQYVVVGRYQEVRFYSRSSSTPLWIHLEEATFFTSVAISADGSYVAAGGSHGWVPSGGYVFFWANAKSLTGDPAPTWNTGNLGGPIWHRCLAISDDGNTVAACGTGPNVFYWADAAGKSGSNVATTWDYYLGGQVEAIAISDKGSHVAAVGTLHNDGPDGVLAYWNNAGTLTKRAQVTWPGQEPTWSGQVLGEMFVDVAISDDGNYVAVAGGAPIGPSTVYYWADATTRTGTSEPHTWAGGVDVIFTSVDISCDGDSVIAGAGIPLVTYIAGGGAAVAAAPATVPVSGSVYFWGGAADLSGNPTPSWIYQTLNPVGDVAINDAGTYMAAVDFPIDTLYFFNRQGNLLWQDQAISGDKLSISFDGGTLAVGTPTLATAYLLDTGYSSPGAAVPVGGVVANLEESAALAPYLALAVLIGAAAVAMIFWAKTKRKD